MPSKKAVLPLLAVATVLSWSGCMPESNERPVAEASAPASAEDVVSSTTYHLIPPSAGPYDDMWRGLRALETLSQPMASGSAERMQSALEEQGGSVPAADVNPEPMIVNFGTPEKPSLWMVAYSDSSLLKPGTETLVRPLRAVLEDALQNEHIRGLSFNPYTKASREEVFNFNVDKLYIAGLIGYLTVKDADLGHRCEAANQAYRENKPYEALHHALRALDEKEEWAQCELAKLWATWEVDFPGARKMARDELVWFIGQGYDTTETRALLEKFETATP